MAWRKRNGGRAIAGAQRRINIKKANRNQATISAKAKHRQMKMISAAASASMAA
jgi:hypothetical protein